MSATFSLPMGEIVAEAVVDGNGVYGTGGTSFPMLVVPLRFTFRCLKNYGASIDFRELHCRVFPFDAGLIAISPATQIKKVASPGQEISDQAVTLEIPIDHVHLAKIDRLRKGGDVRLKLQLEMRLDQVMQLGQARLGVINKTAWGTVEHHHCYEDMQVIIPRSRWVEQVLPGTGFDTVHIIELPAIPVETCAPFDSAISALREAQKLERMGFYSDAIAKCRVALEPFFERREVTDASGNKKSIHGLKQSWQLKLGEKTFDWLDTSLRIIKREANPTHHSVLVFDQAEAQMLITVTTALLSYAARSSSNTDHQS